MDSDTTYKTKIDNQVSRILKIMSVYIPKEELVFECNTFREMINWVETKLQKGELTKNTPVRLKAIYTWNEQKKRDYTSLPKYIRYTFIEPMTVSKESSKIKKLAIDKFERTYIADNDVLAANPFTEKQSTGINTSINIPF
jgi:hypothetical protein